MGIQNNPQASNLKVKMQTDNNFLQKVGFHGTPGCAHQAKSLFSGHPHLDGHTRLIMQKFSNTTKEGYFRLNRRTFTM